MAKRRLSRRQLARIKDLQEQRRQRARQRDQRTAIDSSGLSHEQSGLVIANYGAHAIVEATDGQLSHCAIRQNLPALTCGDEIIWQASGEREGIITALSERRSVLLRPDYSGQLKPVAANVDQIALVIAPRPEPNEFLLDRYLVAIETMAISGFIVINKVDMLTDSELSTFTQRFANYQHIGYKLLFASTRSAQGSHTLQTQLQHQTSILAGQSGVGKSSLINALLPDLDIRVQALSQATGHGTHTTTTTMLYHLPNGGRLIDSPGVRSFELGQISLAELENGFVEFRPHLGLCKFSNCSHTVEPQCALLAAVEKKQIDTRRLASFQQIKATLDDLR